MKGKTFILEILFGLTNLICLLVLLETWLTLEQGKADESWGAKEKKIEILWDETIIFENMNMKVNLKNL